VEVVARSSNVENCAITWDSAAARNTDSFRVLAGGGAVTGSVVCGKPLTVEEAPATVTAVGFGSGAGIGAGGGGGGGGVVNTLVWPIGRFAVGVGVRRTGTPPAAPA
jgi:hypothetical protein